MIRLRSSVVRGSSRARSRVSGWARNLLASSNKLDLPRRVKNHPQKQPAVAESADVGAAVFSFAIAHRDVDDLEVQFGGAEEQVEIAERIELAEVLAVAGNLIIVGA